MLKKASSPLRYPGGKSKAVDLILSKMPNDCSIYCEPMLGGGSVALNVLLKKFYFSGGPFVHVYLSDMFNELMDFWTEVYCLPDTEKMYHDLKPILKMNLEERRAVYDSAKHLLGSNDGTRMERAEAFYIVNRMSFGGTTLSGGFSKDAAMNRFTDSCLENLNNAATLLNQSLSIVLSHKSVFDINLNDPKVFMFLDPPYYTSSKLYGKGGHLHTFDHERLANKLQSFSGKFLMTYDDCPEIRNLYQWAKIETWELQYGVNNNSSKARLGSELFISNY